MSLRTATCNLLSHAVACCDKANKSQLCSSHHVKSFNQMRDWEAVVTNHSIGTCLFWVICILPFETSGTASCGSMLYCILYVVYCINLRTVHSTWTDLLLDSHFGLLRLVTCHTRKTGRVYCSREWHLLISTLCKCIHLPCILSHCLKTNPLHKQLHPENLSDVEATQALNSEVSRPEEIVSHKIKAFLKVLYKKQCDSCILLVCEQVLHGITHHLTRWARVRWPLAAQPDAGYTSWKVLSSAFFCKTWRNPGASSEGSEEAEDGFIPPLSLCYPSFHTVFKPTMPDHACDILYLDYVVRTPLPQASFPRKSFGRSGS